jgi:hypothetical protein
VDKHAIANKMPAFESAFDAACSTVRPPATTSSVSAAC